MRRRALTFVAGIAALGAVCAQDRRITPVTQNARRVALVIGNNAYSSHPLYNSVNDAQAVNSALRDLGFDVQMRLNASMTELENAAERFVNTVRAGEVALFYYSGHGIQIGDQNYLIPVDFDAHTAADAKYKSYAASRIQENLEAAGAALQIIVLDACRDNPFRSLRGAGGGLAPMQAGQGAYIAFATAPGKTADDNPGGGNGLFTGAWIEALRQPGLTLDQVFNRVRGKVSTVRRDQVPWSTSSVVGEFYFRPVAESSTNVRPPGPAPAADADAWEAIRASSNASLFEAFLKEYPTSQYAGAARIKLAGLKPAALGRVPLSTDSIMGEWTWTEEAPDWPPNVLVLTLNPVGKCSFALAARPKQKDNKCKWTLVGSALRVSTSSWIPMDATIDLDESGAFGQGTTVRTGAASIKYSISLKRK
jgi:hypothetical protein